MSEELHGSVSIVSGGVVGVEQNWMRKEKVSRWGVVELLFVVAEFNR